MQPHIESVVVQAIRNADAYISQVSQNTLLYNTVLAVLQEVNSLKPTKDKTLSEVLYDNHAGAVLASLKYIVSNIPNHPTELFTIVSALHVLWVDALKDKINGAALGDLMRYQAAPTPIRPTLKRVREAA